MTTLPTTLAMIAASITTTALFADQNADFNNDGTVDATDLMQVTSNLGIACEGDCPTDLNQDGITDSSDITALMGVWGDVPGWVNPNTPESDEQNDEPDSPSAPVDLSWQDQGPVLLDAIYYDQYTEFYSHGGFNRWNTAKEYNQGEYTKTWTAANGVAVQPTIYGSVDWDHDNNLTEEDKANFAIWLNEYVPADYDGPLCLDLEGQYWGLVDTTNQVVMDSVINVYLEHLEVAKALRPNAKIGFWGFPKKTHTDPNYHTASVDRLVSACTAIFPDVYEWNAGGNDSARLELHVERAMEMVNGQTPVYVQTSPRYKTSSNSPRFLHNQNEFIRDQVQSSMNAVWTDADGKEHRIQGIALWDAYTYVAQFTDGWSEMSMEERKEQWNELDLMHVSFLTEMKTFVDAANEEAAVQKANAQQEADDAAAAQAAAAEAAAAELKAQQQRKRSRLLRRLNSAKTTYARKSMSYRKQARTFRAKRSSWTKSARSYRSAKRSYNKCRSQYKRAIAAAKRQFKNNKNRSSYKQSIAKARSQFNGKRNQFKRSLKTYKRSRANFRKASRSFRNQRNAFRNVRANWISAKKQWRSATAS